MRTIRSMSVNKLQLATTVRTTGRRCAMQGGLVVLLVSLLVAGDAGAPASADTLSYLGQGGGTYWYLASATDDFTWNTGDVVSLTGMDNLTAANAPFGFSVAYTPWAATWTCTEDFAGVAVFTVDSAAIAGQVSYSIVSGSGSSGSIEGPEYTPEPTTVMMFSAGLFALVAVVWRRTRPSQPVK
jgi:hypothetical protein